VPERRVLHPDLSPEERRRLFQEGIDLFNRGGRGDFFLAHEAWEEIWRSTTPEPRELFQGLVQVAAALHQILDLKRKVGPRNTLAKARSHLEIYAPVACGLDVAGLLESVGQWQEWLEQGGARPEVPGIRVVEPERVA
jgi:predicted metal-dependent hydrolase